MIRVHLSSHFHQYTKGATDTTANGATIKDVIDDLERQYPGLRFRMIDEQERVRPHINIFIGNEKADGLRDAVTSDSEVFFMGALSGG